MRYILVDRKPVEEPDDAKWARWFLENERKVADNTFSTGGKSLRISTVFVGINRSISLDPNAPPVLFESIIFDITPGQDCYQELGKCGYVTWDEAAVGHFALMSKLIMNQDAGG